MNRNRRTFFSLLTVMIFAALPSLWAGTRKINVQGKLTDNAGAPLSGAQTVTFKLYDAATAGTMVWTSGVLSITPASGGLFNVPLQDGTPSLDSVSFDKTYFLGITVGADAEMTPRQELGASALAHGSPKDFTVNDNLIVKNGNVGIGTPLPTGSLEVSRNADPSVVFRNAATLAPNNYVRTNMLGGSGPMVDKNFIGAIEGKVVSVSPLKTALWFRTNVGDNSAQVASIDELGQMWATRFNVMSDERLKTDPLPLTETLSKLKKINAKSFNWKKNVVGFQDKKRQIGFYAQEVEAVFPELVSEIEREDGVFKGVDYSGMVPILLEALKAQQKQIEDLTSRLQALEKK